MISLLVGVISGACGLGGEAIVAPILVTLYRLPVHAVAGAMLMGTFATSIVGVLAYQLAAFLLSGATMPVGPGRSIEVLYIHPRGRCISRHDRSGGAGDCAYGVCHECQVQGLDFV